MHINRRVTDRPTIGRARDAGPSPRKRSITRPARTLVLWGSGAGQMPSEPYKMTHPGYLESTSARGVSASSDRFPFPTTHPAEECGPLNFVDPPNLKPSRRCDLARRRAIPGVFVSVNSAPGSPKKYPSKAPRRISGALAGQRFCPSRGVSAGSASVSVLVKHRSPAPFLPHPASRTGTSQRYAAAMRRVPTACREDGFRSDSNRVRRPFPTQAEVPVEEIRKPGLRLISILHQNGCAYPFRVEGESSTRANILNTENVPVGAAPLPRGYQDLSLTPGCYP